MVDIDSDNTGIASNHIADIVRTADIADTADTDSAVDNTDSAAGSEPDFQADYIDCRYRNYSAKFPLLFKLYYVEKNR